MAHDEEKTSNVDVGHEKKAFYEKLFKQASHILRSTRDGTSNMSNIAALIYHEYRSKFGEHAVNWSGFYLVRPYDVKDAAPHKPQTPSLERPLALMLGPFHGKPAVTVIAKHKGVCGECWAANESQFVPDVHKHPNHIACDSASESEIVIPVRSKDGIVVALLDMDSPIKNGFDREDLLAMEHLVHMLEEASDFFNLVDGIASSVVSVAPENAVCTLKRYAHR